MSAPEVNKPSWATGLRKVIDAERQLEESRTYFLSLRCGALESGGARCTADAEPEHRHRYEAGDLP